MSAGRGGSPVWRWQTVEPVLVRTGSGCHLAGVPPFARGAH